MHNKTEFEKEKDKVSKMCAMYLKRCAKLVHRDRRVEQYVELVDSLKENIFGAGELIPKHIMPILSVLGLLPGWMATMSHLKVTSKNYRKLVEKHKIGTTQSNANIFLRALGFAIKRPMTPMGSDDEQPAVAGRVAVGTPDRKVDILYGENVSCKFI